MWRVYRRAIGDLAIWQIASRTMGFSKSDACFHSLNGGCLRPGEGVWAFKTFTFSVGTLDKSVITSVEREGWSVMITWENGMDRPKAGSTDRVYVGYFYDTLPRSPGLITATTVCRGDGQVEVRIPPVGQPEGTLLHLYLFFGSEKGDRFSPSVYVGA